ncbi:hypothetical protein [Litchfieldia alkalitelluris]|uniref:hypothetical protein n=1 Tax=Litchfieldia alkalitelluris TaxID=304268 RepID=UPI000997B203|nr:hypothetical protein [Litchfieldia alkalitelluris]
MIVDLGIFPQSYVSIKPEAGGFFPFAIDGETPYLYDLSFVDRKDEHEVEEFVTQWMKKINLFPIYAFFESFESYQQELDEKCESHSIESTKYNRGDIDFYYRITLRTIEQFAAIFPYVYAHGSMNNFACFSFKKDVFSIGAREFKHAWNVLEELETPITTLEHNTTICWVNYDGDGMILISNDQKFAQLSCVIETLPDGVEYSIIEYDE